MDKRCPSPLPTKLPRAVPLIWSGGEHAECRRQGQEEILGWTRRAASMRFCPRKAQLQNTIPGKLARWALLQRDRVSPYANDRSAVLQPILACDRSRP